MKIISLKKNDLYLVNEIAYIHEKNIKGKLSNLGYKFLSKMYLTFILDKNIKIWVMLDGKKAVGFLCGCLNNKKIYTKFLIDNYFFLFFFFIKNIFSFFILKNIYGLLILLCFFNIKKSSINSELLSIAISKKFRNKSYGKKLIRSLEKYYKKIHISEYIVKVETKNRKAIDFYLSNKFKHFSKAHYPLFDIFYLKKKLF